MEKQITLTLSDTILRRAAGLAAVVLRPIEKGAGRDPGSGFA